MRIALLVAGLTAILLTALLFIKIAGDNFMLGRPPSSNISAERASNRVMASVSAIMALHDAPRELPELRFKDGSGKPLSLADFRGKLVLLNLWATWCGPCREEMPTLDRLQAALGGPDFEVIALSIDRAGIGVVNAFYDEIGVADLARYIDEDGKVPQQLNALGLPTSLLLDHEGREIARHVGPAEWDTPAMLDFLRQQLFQASGALRPRGPLKQAYGWRATTMTSLDSPLAPLLALTEESST